MATAFRYRALDAGGSPVEGVIEATDRQRALAQLDSKGLFPTELVASNGGAAATSNGANGNGRAGNGAGSAATTLPSPAPTAGALTSPTSTTDEPIAERRTTGRVSKKDIAAFTRELAALLEATIPIPQALEGLGQQEESAALKQIILDLASAVRQGASLSEAMQAYPKLFPRLYTSMVEVGEEAGALEKVLTDLAELLEHEEEVRAEVLSAVAYPSFVLLMGVLTTVVLLMFVMPKLFDMLTGMVNTLPLPTQILLSVSTFFQSYWWAVLAGVVALGVGMRMFLKTEDGAFWWDKTKLHLPVLGPVFRSSALSRFARTLGTLDESGVSLLPALEIVRNTVGNRMIARAIDQVTEEARGGDRLAQPLRRLGLFPSTMVQMISVGEETGRLGTMLLRVANMQEKLVRRHAATLISLLAPAMILGVGVLVGFIVISLLLPIFQMSQQVR